MTDPYFGEPFIDEDAWRDEPIRHRYVHGGFAGTDTRFAFHFPEPRAYDGRFLQLLEGGAGGHETTAASAEFAAWAASLGAYLVESNQGHIGLDLGPPDATITCYRASAESARYARRLAAEMYGRAPEHGYVMGGSGGGLRTIYGLERVFDVWDGGVAFVSGDPAASANAAGPHPAAVAGLLGAAKLQKVVDALEPGGGDPFAGLNEIETDALRALFEKTGYQKKALFQMARPTFESLSAPLMISTIAAADPDFIERFWTTPGYAGADGALAERLVDEVFVIRAVLSAEDLQGEAAAAGDARMTDLVTGGMFGARYMGVRVDRPLKAGAEFANVAIQSGRAAGTNLTCQGGFGEVVVLADPVGRPFDDALEVGAEIRVDNRSFLAACLRHKYGPPLSGLRIGGPNSILASLPMTGRFHGKMILVDATLDGMIMVSGQVYDREVREALGETVDDRWRLWWAENSSHTGNAGPPGPRPTLQARLVNYSGMVKQALVDLIDWVEKGLAPAPSSSTQVEAGQLMLAPTAAARQGLQPVVNASAQGGEVAKVLAGQAVTFEVTAEATPFGGSIRSVAWDFDGSGAFADVHDEIDGAATRVHLSRKHRFSQAGTYFPAVRVVALRPGPAESGPMATGYENLARVRVEVA